MGGYVDDYYMLSLLKNRRSGQTCSGHHMNNISMASFQFKLLFEKKFCKSDTDMDLCRLAIPKKDVEERIFQYLTRQEQRKVRCDYEEGMSLTVHDWDEGVDQKFWFKRWGSNGTYVLLREWGHFVRRRAIKACDIVRFWRDTINHRFLITCSSPREISCSNSFFQFIS